jgi:hypothetical protein
MKAQHAIALFVALAGLSIAPVAAQQPMRAPTAEERTILTNYANVLHSILDQIPDDNWVENEHRRYDVDDQVEVSNDPDVPLDINESITREYIIRSGSPLEADRIKVLEPLLEKFKANPTDPATSLALQKADKPTRITVEVHFNRLGAPIDYAPGSAADLKISGPAAAYKSTDSRGEESVVLLYGNWKAGSRFRFRRPGRYPAIENIVIDITGDPDRIDHLLQTVNWKSVNSALTTQPTSPSIQ